MSNVLSYKPAYTETPNDKITKCFNIGIIFTGIFILVLGVIAIYKKTKSGSSNSMNTPYQERYEIIPKRSSNQDGGSSLPSTFCTCSGLIDQTCEDTATRVSNYNNGMNESARLNDKKSWQDPMPYDKFISKPNYEQQSTEWVDAMPYSIYYKK